MKGKCSIERKEMTKVVLYWSNICVLYKQEREFLGRLTEKLREEGVELEVHYFGLGCPMHMSEYMAQPDVQMPDLIVSADLEVFEDPRIYEKISSDLYDARQWLSLRPGTALERVERGNKLLPFLSIPIVYYTREPEKCQETILGEWKGLAFGGINNSAAKTVVKGVWNRYGKEAAEAVLKNALVTDMPIGAFQAVRMGQAGTALVPSLYAMRADEKETFLEIPREGVMLIPSYVCARRSVAEEVLRRVTEGILCEEMCDFYADNGDMIVYPSCGSGVSRQEGREDYFCPEKEWLEQLDPREFYEVYRKYLPTAKDVAHML